jgi:aryl sulfotransferase
LTRIVWLASYPKSGNTWFRMLIANLHANGPVDINDLSWGSGGGTASARDRFDATMLFPSGLLTHDECDRLRPRVYEAIARGEIADPGEMSEPDDRVDTVRFIKTHDAWALTPADEPLHGAGSASHAILIVRDPRDVAVSLAYHNNQTIDHAIAFMARPDAAFCGRDDRQHNQLRQRLPGWSGWNRSWLGQHALPVQVVRYEDLQHDTAGCLADTLGFAGVAADPAAIGRAVRFASFGELRAQEAAGGFREAPPKQRGGRFFRRGIAGAWRDELTRDQAARIVHDHAGLMARFGYAVD